MRTEKEIRVEIQSLNNEIAFVKDVICTKSGDLRTNLSRLRSLETSRDLLRWVLEEL